MRQFVVCLSVCHFVLVFFSPFSIAITSLGEERANLSAFRTSVRFVLFWICRFPLPLGVWEGLRFVIVALPGLFSYLFLSTTSRDYHGFVFVLPATSIANKNVVLWYVDLVLSFPDTNILQMNPFCAVDSFHMCIIPSPVFKS